MDKTWYVLLSTKMEMMAGFLVYVWSGMGMAIEHSLLPGSLVYGASQYQPCDHSLLLHDETPLQIKSSISSI